MRLPITVQNRTLAAFDFGGAALQRIQIREIGDSPGWIEPADRKPKVLLGQAEHAPRSLPIVTLAAKLATIGVALASEPKRQNRMQRSPWN